MYKRQIVANNLQKFINKEKPQKEGKAALKTQHEIQERKLIDNINKKNHQNHLKVTKSNKIIL
jgi:hypothetical protein